MKPAPPLRCSQNFFYIWGFCIKFCHIFLVLYFIAVKKSFEGEVEPMKLPPKYALRATPHILVFLIYQISTSKCPSPDAWDIDGDKGSVISVIEFDFFYVMGCWMRHLCL